MNDLATWLLPTLARTTAILAACAVAVCWLLRWSRASSPGIHRVAWCLVLLQGWLWFRLPVEIPCYEAPQEEPASVAVGPAVPAESPGGWDKSHRVPETTDEAFPGNSPPATRHSSPATRHQASALSAGTAGPTEAAPPLWPAILAAVWLGGMGLMVAGWVGCYLVFLGFLPRGQRAEADWIDQWEELLRSRGVRRAIPMRVTARIGPVLCRLPWGYQLLVPGPLWERLDPAGRLSILRHELAHVERGDVWKSLAVRLLALPHWFNPLAWWAVRRFDEAAEWACDQAVCGVSRNARPEYAKALVVMGETAAAPALFRPAAGRGLSQRIRRLLDSNRREDSLMKKLLVLGVALGLALVCLIRFDLVAKEPAAVLALAAETVRAGPALPAASGPAANPAGTPGPTGAAASAGAAIEPYAALRSGPGRPSFTYDGKPFGQWVAQLRRDLSPERRTEAIKALTAFGSHGYGKEAAEAIVAAMRDYHFDVATVSIMDVNSATSTDPIRIMKRAAMEAVTTRPGRSDDRPAIAPEDAVPVLIDELKQGPPNGRLFAAAACYKIGEAAKSAIPALVELVKTGKDSEVRIGALRAVARVENAGDTTVSLVVEIAKGNDRRLAGYAFGNVVYDILRKHHIGEQSYGPYGPGGRGSFGKVGRSGRGPAETPPIPEELNSLVKAVIEAVADEDRNISDAALSVLRNLGRGPKKEAIPNLIQAIEKHPFSAISGAWTILADLGPEANAALPALEKLRNTLKAEAEQRGVPFGPNLIDDVISRVKGEPSRGAGPSPADARRGRGGPPTRGGAPSGATEGGKPTALSGKSESGEKTAEPPR